MPITVAHLPTSLFQFPLTAVLSGISSYQEYSTLQKKQQPKENEPTEEDGQQDEIVTKDSDIKEKTKPKSE